LPSRDFAVTEAFYGKLGFTRVFHDAGWLILKRGAMEVEFFRHQDLIPADSWFSACVRVDELALLRDAWQAADLGPDPMGRARDLKIDGGEPPSYFALIDCDGSLLRCIDNGSV